MRTELEQAISELDEIIKRFGDDEEIYLRARRRKDELEATLAQGAVSGCFIATAVYSSYDAPEVLELRRFRDNVLLESTIGTKLVKIYYAVSPTLAERLKKIEGAEFSSQSSVS